MKNLVDELLELSDPETDSKIIKSFQLKDTLCPEVFDNDGSGGYTLKKEVSDKLLEITDNFIDFLGVDFFIHDVILTGSLANYNWSEYSDVDLHILIDMDELNDDDDTNSIALHDIVKEFFDAKKNVWNEKHDIKIKGFDVELYVQDVAHEAVSASEYSVLRNEWIKEPKKESPNFNKELIKKKYKEYSKKIDDLMDADSEKPLKDLLDKIYKFRQAGLDKGGELSEENIVFKILRAKGKLDKLKDTISAIYDDKMSVKETT